MINYTIRGNSWLSNVNIYEISRHNYFKTNSCHIHLGFRLTKQLKT